MPSEAEQIMNQMSQSSRSIMYIGFNGVRVGVTMTTQLSKVVAAMKAKKELEYDLTGGEREFAAFLKKGEPFSELEMKPEMMKELEKDSEEYRIQFAKRAIIKKEPLLDPDGNQRLGPTGQPLFKTETLGYSVLIRQRDAQNFNYWVKTKQMKDVSLNPGSIKVENSAQIDAGLVDRIFSDPEILKQYLIENDMGKMFNMDYFVKQYLAFTNEKNVDALTNVILSVMQKCNDESLAVQMGNINDPLIDQLIEEMDRRVAQRDETNPLTTQDKSNESSANPKKETELNVDAVSEDIGDSSSGPVNKYPFTRENYMVFDETMFTPQQLAVIKNGIEDGIPFTAYANPEYTPQQMQMLRMTILQLKDKHPEVIFLSNRIHSIFTNKLLLDSVIEGKYTPLQAVELRMASSSFIPDITPMMNPKLNDKQMYILRNAMAKGFDVKEYISPEYSASHMEAIYILQEKGVDYSRLLDPKLTQERVNEIQKELLNPVVPVEPKVNVVNEPLPPLKHWSWESNTPTEEKQKWLDEHLPEGVKKQFDDHLPTEPTLPESPTPASKDITSDMDDFLVEFHTTEEPRAASTPNHPFAHLAEEKSPIDLLSDFTNSSEGNNYLQAQTDIIAVAASQADGRGISVDITDVPEMPIEI